MTPRSALGWVALLFGCLLLLAGLPACADTPVSLFQSFRGNVNFVGTTETLRKKDNKQPCSLGKKAISATLAGIPSGATIESAQLYWAASGTETDYTVSFDDAQVTAPANRQYLAKPSSSGTVLTYFSGAADVTSQVKKKGNGSYSFSDLTVNNGDPWCGAQTVVGGFALVVVYSHPSEPFRMLNLYEGFQGFQKNSLTLNLSGFNVPNPLPANVTGRIGHITWEGDATLSQGGEDLKFNGYEMTDSYNPTGNQFNSASNVTGDTTTYGIDFDIYTLKSPTIQPGQSSATTTYSSGQDLVLLGAEIVAMPYAANADLALAMTRSGSLSVGNSVNYTLTVTNNGKDTEIGPVTVIDTLPAGLKLVSAGGTGWTCTNAANNGQTIVTCTQSGPVASGATMTPLVIAVTPTAIGNYTNSATVYGTTGDNNSANNTATDSSTAVDYGSAAYLFTRDACPDGQAIVVAPKDAGCHKFLGPVTAGDPDAKIYITAVSTAADGVQRATPRSSVDSTVTLGLAFSCLPISVVPIGYAGLTFDCTGTAKDVNVSFAAGKPSALLPYASALTYLDVGRLSVTMRLGKGLVDTVDFISRPSDIGFDFIRRGDGYPDQKGVASGWPKDDSYGFTRAGDPFTMRVGARMANGLFARSFGKEADALKGKLPDGTLKLDLRLDLFTIKTTVSAGGIITPLQPLKDKDIIVTEAFSLDQNFKFNAAVTDYGVLDATARWFEAGYLGITPFLVDYLGTGQVGGASADVDHDSMDRLKSGTRIVGRFYPDHFETDVTENFACLPAMNCPAASTDPAKPTFPVSGATYSQQAFSLAVKAYGLPRDSKPSLLSLFQHSPNRPIKLDAVKAPNDASEPSAGGKWVSQPLAFSSDTTPYPELKGAATYTLGAPYVTTAPRAGSWSAPTPVYLRAGMEEWIQVAGSTALQKVPVTSIAPAALPRYEDGLVVIAGRVFLPNLFGSELLRLPLPLAAQYWTGKAWVTNTGDDDSKVAGGLAPFNAASCTRSFAASTSPGPCKPGLLNLDGGATAAQLSAGKVTRVLVSPGRGNTGSIDYIATGSDAWLPSTVGRATFGLYKSPLIYLREVY